MEVIVTKEEKRFKRRYRTVKKILVAALILAIGLFVFLEKTDSAKAPQPLGTNEVRFHFMDVGQGDASLISTSEGYILIDAGTAASEDTLKAYLDSLGVTELEYAVFTHPHEDHIGGADMVLRHYTVKRMIIPDIPDDAELWASLLQTAKANACEIIYASPEMIFRLGGLTCTVLAPLHQSYTEENNASIVLRADFGEISVLYMGDTEQDAESDLLTRYGRATGGMLDCDLIKVGHHGADTSSGKAFLEAVTPAFGVISCGKGNSHGHPEQSVLARYQAVKTAIHRTDLEGHIVFSSTGKALQKMDTSA